MAKQTAVIAGVIMTLAASGAGYGAAFNETFQDGNITEGPVWTSISSSSASVVVDPVSADTTEKVLKLGSAPTRFYASVDPISSGSVVTISFKTYKKPTAGSNVIGVGLVDDQNKGLIFVNELANSGINKVRISSLITEGNPAANSSSVSLTNVHSQQPADANNWNLVQITWNTGTGEIQATINGTNAGSATVASTATTDYSRVVLYGAYANAYIDDIAVSVPEPAALGTLGLGVACLLCRRR